MSRGKNLTQQNKNFVALCVQMCYNMDTKKRFGRFWGVRSLICVLCFILTKIVLLEVML